MASFFFRNLKNGFNITKPALETLQLMLVPFQFYVAYDFTYGHKIKGFAEEHFRHTNALINDIPHQVQLLIEKKKKAYPTVEGRSS